MAARLASLAIPIGFAALASSPAWASAAAAPGPPVTPEDRSSVSCTWLDAPDYYSFELERTDKLASVRVASGRASVSSPPSPFGLAVVPDGTISHRVEVSVSAHEAPAEGVLVAWAADPNLERVVRLGEVSTDRPVVGEIALNKFMVFVTLEDSIDRAADRWRGPVILVGRSRSAKLQSMASHGTFEPEPC